MFAGPGGAEARRASRWRDDHPRWIGYRGVGTSLLRQDLERLGHGGEEARARRICVPPYPLVAGLTAYSDSRPGHGGSKAETLTKA